MSDAVAHLIALRKATRENGVITPEAKAAMVYADELIAAEAPKIMDEAAMGASTRDQILANVSAVVDAELAAAGYQPEPDNPRAARAVVKRALS